jgi:hypothetical protein
VFGTIRSLSCRQQALSGFLLSPFFLFRSFPPPFLIFTHSSVQLLVLYTPVDKLSRWDKIKVDFVPSKVRILRLSQLLLFSGHVCVCVARLQVVFASDAVWLMNVDKPEVVVWKPHSLQRPADDSGLLIRETLCQNQLEQLKDMCPLSDGSVFFLTTQRVLKVRLQQKEGNFSLSITR